MARCARPSIALALLLVSLTAAACEQATEAPAPAAATAPPSKEAGTEAVAPTKPLQNPLGPLLELVRERRGKVDGETREQLVSAFDRAVSRAIIAAGVDDLPHAGADRAGTRVIQQVKDAQLGEVVGALVIADGTVFVDHAEDTLIVATDAAYVRECRGCTVIAGRLVVANDAKPGAKNPLSLLWSGAELDVDDAAGAVLSGPMAEALATRLGVIATDEKRMGPTPLSPSPGAAGLRAVEVQALEGKPATVTFAAQEDGRRQSVMLGRSVSAPSGGEPWRLVQAFGLHAALRRDDDLVLLKVDNATQP